MVAGTLIVRSTVLNRGIDIDEDARLPVLVANVLNLPNSNCGTNDYPLAEVLDV